MKIVTGREKEVRLIRQANRAAAMGRLMLGRFNSWQDFLMADMIDLDGLPRRKLKTGSADVKARLTSEIKRFCSKNFKGMDEVKLSRLYERVKELRGLELSLLEFEKEFSCLNPQVLHGCPRHLTVCISLWGLQLQYPEDQLSRDVLKGLAMAKTAVAGLKQYESQQHAQLTGAREKISEFIQERNFAVRAVVTSCFNLLESYLNGISWDYMQSCDLLELSITKKKLLEDTSSANLRDKLIRYPEIITNKKLWDDTDPDVHNFLKVVKPFRDSLVHPSPFPAPEKFGGYDKLRKFYNLDFDTALETARLLGRLLKRIHSHIDNKICDLPRWLMDFNRALGEMERFGAPLEQTLDRE